MKRVFIIGAMRSGSSSLTSYLKQHPNIFNSRVKEPNFMIFHSNGRNFLRTDGSPMKPARYAVDRQEYDALFEDAPADSFLVDASSSYISYPHAAKTIASLFPDAYIIATLREPITRAISAYRFNCARGTESRDSLETALEMELSGESENYFAPWRYLHCGDYSRNLKPYFENFPREQILLQTYDHFNNDPKASLSAISQFVGLTPFEFDTSNVVNASSAPNAVSRGLNRLLLRNGPITRVLKGTARSIAPSISTTSLLKTLESLPGLAKAQPDKDLTKATQIAADFYRTRPTVEEIIEPAAP